MKKIIQTKQQRENTLDALNVMWPSVPPENVYRKLEDWRDDLGIKPPSCNTVACFGGWCAWWPNFMKQGVVVAENGWGYPTIKGMLATAWSASDLLFGADIFSQRNGHIADDGFTGTDHELITHRLQWVLKNSEVAK